MAIGETAASGVRRIDVVGLGPAGEDLLTVAARDLLATAPVALLRTRRHPAASALGEARSFDHLYDSLGTFEEVYAAIVEALLDAATAHGHVAYAVPGSPVVAERTVDMLRSRAVAEASLEVVVHPALSFLDLAWARLGVDPVGLGVTLVDAHRFAVTRPSRGGAALVAQCESRFTLSDVKLAVDPPPEGRVVLLWHLGLPEERIVEVHWADIDRSLEADHLTSLWVPDLPPTAGGQLERFADLLERLRMEDPWKAAQTHDSLKRYLLEEAHELLEAIDAYDSEGGGGAEELASELGDLLYQVVFHSSLAGEAGWFELSDVVAAIHDKLESRHPHLGGDGTPTVAELVADWERAKVAEHGRSSTFDGIPADLPALLRALKVLRKAEALGLDLPPGDGGTGARLFDLVAEAAGQGIDPEDALRRHVRRVEADLRRQE